MIPTEVADIARALRRLVPILGFNRSVKWAWTIYDALTEGGWVFQRRAALQPQEAHRES